MEQTFPVFKIWKYLMLLNFIKDFSLYYRKRRCHSTTPKFFKKLPIFLGIVIRPPPKFLIFWWSNDNVFYGIYY